jgi:hypothetical protein
MADSAKKTPINNRYLMKIDFIENNFSKNTKKHGFSTEFTLM